MYPDRFIQKPSVYLSKRTTVAYSEHAHFDYVICWTFKIQSKISRFFLSLSNVFSKTQIKFVKRTSKFTTDSASMIGYIEFLPPFRTVLVEIPVFTFFIFELVFWIKKTTIFKNLRWSAACMQKSKTGLSNCFLMNSLSFFGFISLIQLFEKQKTEQNIAKIRNFYFLNQQRSQWTCKLHVELIDVGDNFVKYFHSVIGFCDCKELKRVSLE